MNHAAGRELMPPTKKNAKDAKVVPIKPGQEVSVYPWSDTLEAALVVHLAHSEEMQALLAPVLNPKAMRSTAGRLVIESIARIRRPDPNDPRRKVCVATTARIAEHLRLLVDEGKVRSEDADSAIDAMTADHAAGYDEETTWDGARPHLQRALAFVHAQHATRLIADIGALDKVRSVGAQIEGLGLGWGEALKQVVTRRSTEEATNAVAMSDADAFVADAERGPPKVVLSPHLPSLAKCLDIGGFVEGDIVVVCGPPGALKTGLVTDTVRRWSRGVDGVYVSIYAGDEAARRLRRRVVQADGVQRGALIVRDSTACLRAAEVWRQHYSRLRVEDATKGMFIEDVINRLVKRAGTAPKVLVIDSIQKMRTRAHSSGDRRTDLDASLEVVEALVKQHDIITIALSEVGRGAYSAKGSTPDLAAAAESRRIEYFADVQIVLRRKDDQSPVIATVPKNRLGQGAKFAFGWDRDTATTEEVPLDDAAPSDGGTTSEEEYRTKTDKRRENLIGRVRKALTGEEIIRTKERLYEAMGPGNRNAKVAIVTELLRAGSVIDNKKTHTLEWKNEEGPWE